MNINDKVIVPLNGLITESFSLNLLQQFSSHHPLKMKSLRGKLTTRRVDPPNCSRNHHQTISSKLGLNELSGGFFPCKLFFASNDHYTLDKVYILLILHVISHTKITWRV
jgi:hypothetical protein